MSRAYLVYILMFAMLAGGLWVILTFGTAMRAPDDLSGDWAIRWESPPPAPGGQPVMHIDQSGRFFVVRFPNRRPISMTLQPGWNGARDGRSLRMQLAGDIWKMNVAGDIPLGNTWRIPRIQFELIGPSRHMGTARRAGVEIPATRPSGIAHAR